MPYVDVDRLARNLSYLGSLGRRMNHSWDGGGITIPLNDFNGNLIGKILPGRGLYVDVDLKSIGIRRSLPFVYERTPVQRFFQAFGNYKQAVQLAGMLLGAALCPGAVMANISSYDDFVTAAYANGGLSDLEIVKNSLTTVANNWSSLGKVGGTPGALTYTNIPGGAVLDSASTNSWLGSLNTDPTTGQKTYLVQLGIQSGTAVLNIFLLADFLVAAGNISANTTSPNTVNSTALTRHTSGVGCEYTLEVTTALSTTGSNVTVSYTNQAGTAGQSSGAQAMTTSAIVGRLQPVALAPFTPMASGDYGIQSIQTVTFSAAMGGGVVAAIIYYPICFYAGLTSSFYIERDIPGSIDGLFEMAQSSGQVLGCPNILVLPNSTSTNVVDFHFKLVTG